MTLWWIGNVVYLGAIVPVVVVLLTRLLRAALAVKQQVDALAESTRSLTDRLDGLGELERTPGLARSAGAGLDRYGRALGRRR